MPVVQPTSAQALAAALLDCAQANLSVKLFGNNSKKLAGGPDLPADRQISTRSLNRILHHEKNDLTISVEAGMRFSALQQYLLGQEQMIALAAPFSAEATVAGLLATESQGAISRRFGSARDQVIGMSFAMMDGRLIKTGGMVVKNVAGLDMAKLLLGSFGTLAAITSVNLRVHPRPKQIRTFLLSFRDLESAIEKRNQILRGPLTPWAIDMYSSTVATRFGRRGPLLAIRAAGSRIVLERYAGQVAASEMLDGDEDTAFWQMSSDYIPEFLGRNGLGVVLKIATNLSEVVNVFKVGSGSYLSHAATGLTYAFFTSWQSVGPFLKVAREKHWGVTLAYGPDAVRQDKEVWKGSFSLPTIPAFDMMKRIKGMFDPANLLNRSRLYGCL